MAGWSAWLSATLRNIYTFRVLLVDVWNVSFIQLLLCLFDKCMVMECCVICEQMLLVLGVFWLQLGFQHFEFCGSKKDHWSGVRPFLEDGCGSGNFVVGVWHRMLPIKVGLLGQLTKLPLKNTCSFIYYHAICFCFLSEKSKVTPPNNHRFTPVFLRFESAL